MMKKILLSGMLSIYCFSLNAGSEPALGTKRIDQFSNSSVQVWKTVIYPNGQQQLSMHRHDNNRVVVALTDGVLKVTNNKGKTHFIALKKDNAYFLEKDVPNEMHTDENVTPHLIKVMVVELKHKG